jgi:hypothetical protein
MYFLFTRLLWYVATAVHNRKIVWPQILSIQKLEFYESEKKLLLFSLDQKLTCTIKWILMHTYSYEYIDDLFKCNYKQHIKFSKGVWCLLTYGAEPFLRSCQLCSNSGTSQHFKEPEGSSPCSQEPSTGPYPEPDRSSPYHPILSL